MRLNLFKELSKFQRFQLSTFTFPLFDQVKVKVLN